MYITVVLFTCSQFKPNDFKLPTLITKTSPFPILAIFHSFYQIFKRRFCHSGLEVMSF